METLNKNELIKSYREAYRAIPQEALDLDLRVTFRTMQALAEGKPVSPKLLAEIWGMTHDQVEGILNRATANGQAQVDAQGFLIGGILSLVPTTHQISLDGMELYAWCAYDAIYAPGVVGKNAEIVSTDPVTGDKIRISITPSGVKNVQPESTVVSVVSAKTDLRAGPSSPRCTQQLFFGSRNTAEKWLENRAGVAILSLEEVFEIAREFQIEPARRLGLV